MLRTEDHFLELERERERSRRHERELQREGDKSRRSSADRSFRPRYGSPHSGRRSPLLSLRGEEQSDEHQNAPPPRSALFHCTQCLHANLCRKVYIDGIRYVRCDEDIQGDDHGCLKLGHYEISGERPALVERIRKMQEEKDPGTDNYEDILAEEKVTTPTNTLLQHKSLKLPPLKQMKVPQQDSFLPGFQQRYISYLLRQYESLELRLVQNFSDPAHAMVEYERNLAKLMTYKKKHDEKTKDRNQKRKIIKKKKKKQLMGTGQWDPKRKSRGRSHPPPTQAEEPGMEPEDE